MEPRLKTSKKWTGFPEEFQKQIESIFAESFPEQATQGQFRIEGRIYPEEIIFRAGYVRSGQINQINFEVSLGYSHETDDFTKRLHLAVDASASLMLEYFESIKSEEINELDLPYTWQEILFDGQKIYMQVSRVNTDLERQADLLLGESQSLVFDQEGDTDALGFSEAHHVDLESLEHQFQSPKNRDQLH